MCTYTYKVGPKYLEIEFLNIFNFEIYNLNEDGVFS